MPRPRDPLLNLDVFRAAAETGLALTMPGGCDDCDAEQVIQRDGDRLWRITVRHDEDCPRYARLRGRR